MSHRFVSSAVSRAAAPSISPPLRRRRTPPRPPCFGGPARRDTAFAWTDSSGNGTDVGADCSGWTSAAAAMTGRVGRVGRPARAVERGGHPPLRRRAGGDDGALYCFSTEPILFWDGFERGGLEAWSSHTR